MRTSAFWLDAAERALKTAAQTLLALWGTDGLDLLSVSWGPALSVAGGAALLSVLTSIASSRVGDPGTASVVVSRGRHARDEE